MAAKAGRGGDRSHPLKDRGHDLNETPPEAVHALLAHDAVPDVLWEPACGPGAMVRVLRASGRTVYATDLVDYRTPDQDAARRDFLMERAAPVFTPADRLNALLAGRRAPKAVEAVVTNPPFKIAALFAARALELVPKVYLLLRLAFLEAGNDRSEAGRARLEVLDGGKLARVYVFRNRLPMMHRAGWKGKKAGSSIAFAWFVWDRAWSGPAELHRISWEKT